MVLTTMEHNKNVVKKRKQRTKQFDNQTHETIKSTARALLGLINHKSIKQAATNQQRNKKTRGGRKL
jgi:hypothetical protein